MEEKKPVPLSIYEPKYCLLKYSVLHLVCLLLLLVSSADIGFKKDTRHFSAFDSLCAL